MRALRLSTQNQCGLSWGGRSTRTHDGAGRRTPPRRRNRSPRTGRARAGACRSRRLGYRRGSRGRRRLRPRAKECRRCGRRNTCARVVDRCAVVVAVDHDGHRQPLGAVAIGPTLGPGGEIRRRRPTCLGDAREDGCERPPATAAGHPAATSGPLRPDLRRRVRRPPRRRTPGVTPRIRCRVSSLTARGSGLDRPGASVGELDGDGVAALHRLSSVDDVVVQVEVVVDLGAGREIAVVDDAAEVVVRRVAIGDGEA